MSDVKLFRVTEFAESVFSSPLAHRTAIHPFWVMLLVAVWVATAGHWPLWLAMLEQARSGVASWSFLAALFGKLMLSALLILALTCWRWTIKPAIALLLLWSALGACVMALNRAAGEGVALSPQPLLQFMLALVNWKRLLGLPCLLTLLLVWLVPTVLIWRGRLRRIPSAERFGINVVLLLASYGLLVGASGLFGHAVPSHTDPLAVLHSFGSSP